MAHRASVPKEIRRLGTQSVRVVWDDGHQSEYPNRYLRDHCPCAACRQRPQRSLPVVSSQAGEIYPVQMGVVGRYALNIQWSDSHDTGIYSYQTLRELCPCEQCLPVATGESAKAT